MHDDWLAHLLRQRELFSEGAPLLHSRRIVVMVVEPTFADSNAAGVDNVAQLSRRTRRNEANGIVRMHSGGGVEESRISVCECGCRSRGAKRVICAASRADADDRARPGCSGALDYLVAVAGERRVGEVRVAVDEVWNAVVLRGHLRSIHKSTGLAT